MDTVELLKSLFITFGVSWILWLLFALSFISVIIAVERALFFRRKSAPVEALVEELDRHLSKADHEQALALLATRESVGATVARAGIGLAERGPEAADKVMRSALALERKLLEARLTYLATVGNNAPFVGLFGTVIGVILAFEELGHASGAGAAMAGQAASTAVMGAIAEALVATAVGIAVALPAVAIYNVFQRRIDALIADAEVLSNLVLAYLSTERPRREARGFDFDVAAES